ncbi:FAD-binding oxidoreductase [Marinobacter sp. JSM 1782161]|uniref:FAD-binding oxidoreductase n=1 Tax=Marinobacter sp. JSM 1782161 TaxID=2685906 RepID=UPI001403B0A7|nr:FAD-binding oxidoreductase [Marinobacter sp. JSM 1782161]
MASPSDIRRARQLAQATLEDLDSLDQSRRNSGDAGLRSMLSRIHQRRWAQSSRLLEWAGRQMGGVVPEIPTDRGEAGTDAAEPEPGANGTPSPTAEDPTRPTVSDIVTVTDDLVRFTVPRPADFRFEPGQSVKVGVGDVRRSFSIVSAPHEPQLEFFVERVPGGRMSEQLRNLTVGQPVDLGTPKGGLRFDSRFASHLMISTVTGVNPFISILRAAFQQTDPGQRFHVLQGASYQDEFGYADELTELATAHPNQVCYLATVSRPNEARNAGWSGCTGRVDTLVEAYIREAGLRPEDTLVYLCGHSGMIDALTPRCRELGFEVRTESYD